MTLVHFAAATVLVVILTNKVLSPQYIVWVLPFVALLSPRKSLLFLAIVVLTTLVYPLEFQALIKLHPVQVVLLNVRNALLVVFFAWVTWPQRGGQNEAMFENPPTSPAATPKMINA